MLFFFSSNIFSRVVCFVFIDINKQSTFSFNSHLQSILINRNGVEVFYGFQLFRRADLMCLSLRSTNISDTCALRAHSATHIFILYAHMHYFFSLSKSLEFICHWLLLTDKTNRDIKKTDKNTFYNNKK